MKKRIFTVMFNITLVLSLLIFELTIFPDSKEAAFAQSAEASVKGEGTQNRNWITGKEIRAQTRYEVNVEENIVITVRDGIAIRGRLLLPEGVEGPLPTIVQLNGYGHGIYGNYHEEKLIDLAERGYAVLHVSMRGTGTSDGEAGLYKSYGNDGYDVIEWAAQQEWSNGKVGTTGSSLLGISQWLAAKNLPPSLKAISPAIACADCYETLWHPGGMEAGPGRIARKIEFSEAKAHRDFDGWWQERTVSPEELNKIADHGVAAFITAGWNDYISPGNIDAFKRYSEKSGDVKLIVSRGAHSYLSGVAPYEFNDYQALWFDHYLKGEANGIEQRDPVLIFVQGANQWRYEKAWPLQDTNYVDLYLSDAKSGSINSQKDGSLIKEKPVNKDASAMYKYSPEIGPFLPTLLSSNGRLTINQQPYEKQTVTWTTDTLAEPTEVTGNMSIAFWAAINAKDADFVVQVTDVAPDGTSKQVTAGYLNAARANSTAEPIEITPGKVQKYSMNILPTSYVFKKGHKIRLSLAGGAQAYPGQKSPHGPGKNPIASTVVIYQNAMYPSSFRLPVIGQKSFKFVGKAPDVTAPGIPSVNAVYDYSVSISGKGESNSKAYAYIGSKKIGEATVKNGAYTIKIAKQKAGSSIRVFVMDAAKNKSKSKSVTVIDKTAPSIPSVNTVTNAATVITGKAESSAKVYAYVGTKKIGGTTSKNNAYTIKIAKQKTGTSIKVHAIDAAKNKSKNKTIKVASAPKSVQYKTTVNLNMRSSASTKNKIITTIPKGKKVQYISKSGTWSKVKYGTKTGWVSSSYLRKI